MLKIKTDNAFSPRFYFNKTKIEVWGYAISIFLLSMPYFMWHTPFPLAPFLLLFCLLLSFNHLKVSSQIVIPLLGIFLLYAIVLFRAGYTIYGIGSTLLILPIFLLDKKFLSDVFVAYSILFSVTIIPSIIVYALIVFFGLEFQSNIISPLNISKIGDYLQYPFLVVFRDSWNISPRFYGYYDEPGVVGTISGVLLIINKFNFKNKFNIPIFIAGVFSISFYFFVICAIYIIIYAKTIYKVVAIALCTFLVSIFYSNEILYSTIFKRFEIIDGSFVGDNRIDYYSSVWYEKFQNSSDYLFGVGGYSNWRENYHGASYKELIINYGLIFFILYVVFFLLLSFKLIKKPKEFSIYVLILLSILYQRPFIDDMLYVFLLYASIFVLSRQSKIE